MKALIAEDERVPRTLLAHQISRWGYEVVETDNGDAAWLLLNANDPPRIAVLDWVMPGLDGVAICQKLHENPDRPFTYTLLLTAKTDESDLVYALSQGAHDFLSKPARFGELRARLTVARRLVEANDRLREYASRMEELATTDSLTGAANRRSLFDFAERELARNARYQTPCTALLLDVDAFKEINDRHGHAAGDSVLKRVVEVCRQSLRNTDIVARLGGDEFVILLPQTIPEAAFALAERLHMTIETTDYGPDWKDLRATVSIGISGCNGDHDIHSLLRNADRALYQAKQAGRNRVYHAPTQSGP